MKLFGYEITRSEARNAENPRIPVSAENFWAKFGIEAHNLPAVTIDSALQVTAVTAAVAFLSRSLATLPLHAYRKGDEGPVRISGKLEKIIHENPNPYQDSFKFRQYLWQQVFTGGRALAWIERGTSDIEALWPIDPTKATIQRKGFKVVYGFDGKEYAAEDVIDIAFMPKSDMLGHHGPIALASKAIQLALAMNDYASGFFAGGGVPPLVMSGPIPAGNEAMKRAMSDVSRSIDAAKKSEKPLFAMPPGYDLKAVGFDPEKGQMTEARRFQIEEIARAYQLPPVFLQDLSHGTFSNVEQQDLHLVKHTINQWCTALEGEMNLKLFGRFSNVRYVDHNIDGLLRGDFLSRMTGYSSAIQHGVMTPDEAREKEGRQNKPGGDKLYMQGAMVALDMIGKPPAVDPNAAAQASEVKSMVAGFADAVRNRQPDQINVKLPDMNIPEIRIPDIVARVEIPKMDAPVVHVAAPVIHNEQPVVNVAAPIVNVAQPEKKGKRTRTVVKKHDAKGRISEFEQEEIE